MENLPKVSIIIVTANNISHLKKCLDSISMLDYPKQKIETLIVHDINNEQDKAAAFIKQRYKHVKSIKTDRHNYSYSNNLGIKKSKGELVMTLNDDIKLNRTCLKELVSEIIKDKMIGGIGPKILFDNGKINWTGHEEHPNFYFGETGFNQHDNGQYNKTNTVSSLCNAAALYRRECIKNVGYLDEDFNMYYEDIDFGRRCIEKRWSLVYNPLAIAYHKHHGTISQENFKQFTERSRLLYVAKHFPSELPKAITTSHLFYKDIANEHEVLFDALPDAVAKLAKHHGDITVQKILPEIMKEIKKIVDFEKHDFLKTAKDYNTKLDNTRAELDNTRAELDNTRAELEKNKELLYSTSQRLKGFYNSKGYKYLLSPVWSIVNKFKKS